MKKERTVLSTHPDLICLSHLRWNFVFQRPQHLMSRFARGSRVFFVEEPVWHDAPSMLEIGQPLPNVTRVVPHLNGGLPWETVEQERKRLLGKLLEQYQVHEPLLWFYTPMALEWLPDLSPRAVIYDVMDELSLFRSPPPGLLERETELFQWADVVFTGGPSLYQSKRSRHGNVHCFPSSIDRNHFAQARNGVAEPEDQRSIARPRIGFFGVIDERMDLELLGGLAAARPDWHLVMVGPVAKIDPAELPQASNLHYLGMKSYDELPKYLAGWDVAIIPFSRSEATRFISPTKTPEYLAGGVPVISTPIRDVVQLYGPTELVHIAETVPAFVEAIEEAMEQRKDAGWLGQIDRVLAHNSWDATWTGMSREIEPLLRGFPQRAPIL